MSPRSLVAIVLCLLSLVTRSNAVVYGWGKNDQAQLGLNHQNIVYSPTSIPFYANIPLIDVLTATNYHIALAANGSAFGCGLQYYGQFANGYSSTTAIKTPIACPTLNTSLDISLPGTSCNANMNTNLLGWANVAGYVQGKTTGTFPRVQVALPSYRFDGKVLAVNSVMEGVIVRLANNTVWAAGNNGFGRLGNGNANTIYNFAEVPFWRTVPLKQIFSSQSPHVCGVSVNNSLFCWGQNSYGQLGVGDTTARYTPTRVTYFDDNFYEIYKVSYGDSFTMVLTCGGRLFAFGANAFGQLGQTIPDTGAHPNPVEVTSFSWNGNIVELVTGYYQTMVRTSDNKWWVWGAGSSGSLGTGNSKDAYTPTLSTTFAALNINRIRGSSQTMNFFGWFDSSVTNDRLGCPVLENECLTGNNSCDPNGYCIDYERGYTCACNSNWIGDGFLNGTGCVNPNTCEATICVVNATCDDSSGIAICTCPGGYQGDGLEDGNGCSDIDECSLGNPCASNAFCTNKVPGYTCSCNPGFIGDPVYVGCTILCQPGQYATNQTACDSCPPGTYTDVTGSPNCFPCPGGTFNNEWGSDSLDDCQKCPTGGYSEPKATFCSLCVHGYTNDPSQVNTDNSTCTACPLGTYGYYGVCIPCNSGKFSTDAVAQQCHNCPPGYINTVTDTASLFCTPCPAGTSSRGGTTSCSSCAAGYYSTSGSKDCLKCPVGTSTNGQTGQTTCSNCTAGYYSNRAAAQNCAPCPAGTYSTGPGTANCIRCPPGTFSPSQGSTSCTACSGGLYASGSGNTKCSQCDTGLTTTDGITCTPCTAGYFFDTATRACKPCAPGTFVAVSGTTACYACAAGTYTSSSGSTYCKRCDINTYSNADTGFANCTACPAGTKSPGGAYVCN